MSPAAPPEAGSGAHVSHAAAGSEGASSLWPVKRLARLLSETDEGSQASQLAELGVTDPSFLPALRRSFQACRRGVLLYPGDGELAVSFNGGKDACVVLYLWLAAVLSTNSALGDDDEGLDRLGSRSAIYFYSSDEFDEVRDFVSCTVKEMGLSMATVAETEFKQGMGDMVARGLRAVVMGQRRTDPWMADMEVYSPSSDGWPPFMRINPILDWTYSQIWGFFQAFGLPYCQLYDAGYTSLGSVPTTFPNPDLQRADGSYMPAWQLEDGSRERAGRVSRKASKPFAAADKAACCDEKAAARPRHAAGEDGGPFGGGGEA